MKRILQIGYDAAQLRSIRELLKSGQYNVLTVRGNTVAARLSLSNQKFSLVIIGQTDESWMRRAMVGWLKSEKPATPVMALNSDPTESVPQADYNCVMDESNNWLSAVGQACLAGAV